MISRDDVDANFTGDCLWMTCRRVGQTCYYINNDVTLSNNNDVSFRLEGEGAKMGPKTTERYVLVTIVVRLFKYVVPGHFCSILMNAAFAPPELLDICDDLCKGMT